MTASKAIEGFMKDDRSYRGYTLVEYSLLIALLVLGSSAISPKLHRNAPPAGNTQAAVMAGE